MKLLFTILIVYVAYKIMFKPNKIEPPRNKKNISPKNNIDKGEYVDYEEVD